MFIEIRRSGINTKYYLVHSYRDKQNKVKKIRKFLGSNLSKTQLEKLQQRAEVLILERIKESRVEVFEFSLSEKEIEKLNKLSKEIKIVHLDKEAWKLFTEDFVYNTNAIEGSTVLRDEIPKILEKKRVTDPEEIETKGVAKAIGFIRTIKQEFSLSFMKKLHLLCFAGSKDFAGKFRDVEVAVVDREGNVIHSGIPVKEMNEALEELVEWYKENKQKFTPIVLAGIIHNQFENIHPFADGNGRVGRLLLNYILLRHKYPPINILLEDRATYYKVLQDFERRHKVKPIVDFLIKQYQKTLKQVTTQKKKS